MNSLKDRVAFITGGTNGIGLAIATKLAKEGYKLALIYSQNETAAKSAQQKIGEVTSEVMVVKADVADEKKVQNS